MVIHKKLHHFMLMIRIVCSKKNLYFKFVFLILRQLVRSFLMVTECDIEKQMLRSMALPLLRKFNIINNISADSPLMGVQIPVTHPFSEEIAYEYLKFGMVLAVPTDTVYGLACDATNVGAITKLYNIKARNKEKPIAICLGSVSDLNQWANIKHLPTSLLHSLLPGPVTLILESINNNLDSSLCLKGKVGIRIPDYSFIRTLSLKLDKPLALTSANLSNEPSAIKISQFKNIWNKVPIIFDGGTLNLNSGASTIVDLSESGSFKVIRVGAALEETITILKQYNLKDKS